MATRKEIRDAIGKLAVQVPGVAGVHTHRPPLVHPSLQPWVYVHVSDLSEYRHGLGGERSGKKWQDWTVRVHIWNNVDAASVEQAEADFEAILEGLELQFRTNQTLGGVGVRFGEDIRTSFDDPIASDGRVIYHAVIMSGLKTEITA